MDLGDGAKARSFLDETIISMRAIIGDLLSHGGVSLEPGDLVRTSAADLTGGTH